MRAYSNFASRPTKEYKEQIKYFLIYEGAVTEPMYFSGIIENREYLKINQNVGLISILRSIDDVGKSHPKHLLSMAEDIKNKNNSDTISKETLLKSIKDFMGENKLNDDNVYIMASNYIEKYANDVIPLEELNNVLIDIYKDSVFKDLPQNIIFYFNQQYRDLDYNEDMDIINLIVDRDANSFKAEQYDNLVEECKNNKINLYVSNPCFEAWLLMHYEEFDRLDFEKLKENKRVNGKHNSKKYSEKVLTEITGHDKLHLDFEMFKDKIEDAIKRESHYAETLEKLKDNVGSNVGKLITNLKEK